MIFLKGEVEDGSKDSADTQDQEHLEGIGVRFLLGIEEEFVVVHNGIVRGFFQKSIGRIHQGQEEVPSILEVFC